MKKFFKNIVKLKKISTIKDFRLGTFPSISGSGSGYTFYRPPLGWTSGHERWAHVLKILLSRNELITQALHLSFSRYSFASKHIQC